VIDTLKTSRKTVCLQAFLFAVLIAGSVFLLRPLRESLHSRLSLVRADVISQVEAVLGRSIAYDSVRLSFFSVLDVRNIVVSGRDSEPVISVPRARVAWSLELLMRLLLDRDFASVTRVIGTVKLDNPVIRFDAEKDADLAALFTKSGGKTSGPLLLDENTVFIIKNGTVILTDRAYTCEIKGLSLDASVRNDRLLFKGKWAADVALGEALSKKITGNDPFTGSASMAVSGSCGLDFADANARITLASFRSGLFSLKPLTFNASLSKKTVELAGANVKFPFDVSVRYDLENGDVSGKFVSENFSPSDLVSLAGPFKGYQKWLKLTTSGSASFSMSGADSASGNAVNYSLMLSGAVPFDAPLGRVAFAVNGSGNESRIDIKNLSFRTRQGEAGFAGRIGFTPFAPFGIISIADFSLSGKEKASAELVIATTGREISLSGESITLGRIILLSPNATIFMGKNSLNWLLSVPDVLDVRTVAGKAADSATAVEPTTAVVAGSTVRQGASVLSATPLDAPMGAPPEMPPQDRIVVDGVFDYKPQNIDARFVLNGISVSSIAAMAEPFVRMPEMTAAVAAVADEVTVDTEVFVTTDFIGHFLYNAPLVSVAYKGGEAKIEGSLSGTDQHIEYSNGHLFWGKSLFDTEQLDKNRLDMAFSADFANPKDIIFDTSVSYLDTNYSASGMILDKNTVNIQGSYGFNAYLNMTDDGISGYLETDRVPIPFQSQVTNFTVRSSLRYASLESWSANFELFEAANIATPLSASTSIRISGSADQNGALFPTLFFDDGLDALTGSSTLFWADGFSDISGTIELSNESSQEQYYIAASCTDAFSDSRVLKANLSVTDMRLAHWLRESYNAVVSGTASLDWESINSFSAEANIASLSAQIADATVRLAGAAALNDTEARLSNVEVRYGNLNGSIPSFTVSRVEKHAQTSFEIQGTAASRIVDVSGSLAVDFNSIASWLDIGHVVDAFNGRLVVDNARFDSLQSSQPFDFAFAHADKAISLSGGPEDMLRFKISDSGNFYLGLAKPFPVRGSIVGSVDSANIDAIASNIYIDLAALMPLLPAQEILSVTGGFVRGDLQVRGPIGAPEFFGQAIGNSVCLQVPSYLPQEIRPVPMTVTFTGDGFYFGPIPAAVGTGIGMVTGSFHFDGWVPSIFNIDITATVDTPLPINFDISGIMVKGSAVGDLHLIQDETVFKVVGDIIAQNTEVTLNLEELDASANVSPMDLSVPVVIDIKVTTGNKVEFLWPTDKFPIIQAYADLGTVLSIESDTTTGKFALIGDVDLRSGEIFYFERSFYLQQGVLAFNENEVSFDPRISARAESRDRTDDGPVTISLIVDNAPLSSFTARLESNPPLSQVAIFSLLGQNMTGAPSEDGNSAMQNLLIASSADILAQTQVVRVIERQLRNWLHLDMFSMRTQVLQNLILRSSAFQSQPQGDATLEQERKESQLAVGNYFDNTTVYVGKYITSNMFFQGMLSLRYDDRRGMWSGLNVSGLSFEPEFSFELRNPFFDVQWNLSLLHPENLFVDDMSITLRWRKSF
jgi:hypothetical protein